MQWTYGGAARWNGCNAGACRGQWRLARALRAPARAGIGGCGDALDAPVVGVHVRGVTGMGIAGLGPRNATSPFDGVTAGLGSARTDCGGVARQKSLALGTGPIDESTSVAQLICMGSCGAGTAAVRPVGDGVGSRTSHGIFFHSLASTSCSIPFARCSPLLSTLSNPRSLVSHWIVSLIVFGPFTTAVWASSTCVRTCTEVGATVTCHTSVARSRHFGVVAVS